MYRVSIYLLQYLLLVLIFVLFFFDWTRLRPKSLFLFLLSIKTFLILGSYIWRNLGGNRLGCIIKNHACQLLVFQSSFLLRSRYFNFIIISNRAFFRDLRSIESWALMNDIERSLCTICEVILFLILILLDRCLSAFLIIEFSNN